MPVHKVLHEWERGLKLEKYQHVMESWESVQISLNRWDKSVYQIHTPLHISGIRNILYLERSPPVVNGRA